MECRHAPRRSVVPPRRSRRSGKANLCYFWKEVLTTEASHIATLTQPRDADGLLMIGARFGTAVASARRSSCSHSIVECEQVLDLAMRVAGPEETMHPAALASYRQFERALAVGRP